MRMLLSIALLSLSLQSFGSSESTLKSCSQKAITAAGHALNGSIETKTVLKAMNESIKDCKDSVAAQVKLERDAKRKAKLADQIKKLQAKLSAN